MEKCSNCKFEVNINFDGFRDKEENILCEGCMEDYYWKEEEQKYLESGVG